ncbi:MAG: YrdB family protein [Calditrichaeota bacterium]|nr:YrdB family protein [Calditrichota bacterium]
MIRFILCVCLAWISLCCQQTIFQEYRQTRLAFQADTGEIPTMQSWNLYLRGGLELTSLVAMGYWGYDQGSGENWAAALLIPASAAAIWGIFAVKDDPSRSGETVINTPGWLRLLIELGFFTFASYGLQDMGQESTALVLGSATILHYSFSLDRIKWLLEQ